MKKLILITVLFIISISFCFAQKTAQYLKSNLNHYSAGMLDFYNEVARNKIKEINNLDNIQGSPYAEVEFQKGYVITKDSLMYSPIHLRYNNYKDVMEFEKDDIAYEISNQFPIIQAKLNDKIFERYIYSNNNEQQLGYFELHQKGKYSLYSKNEITYEEPKPAKGYQDAKLACFKKSKPVFFIKDQNDKMSHINSKKDIKNIFNSKSPDILKFIKSNKLNFNKIEDLIKLTNFCNQLD